MRDAGRLLHVVGDDHDRELPLSSSISSSILAVEIGSSAEDGSSSRITSGLMRDGAGDAEALLLAAGQTQAGLAQLVLHLVPQGRLAKSPLDPVVELGARKLLVEADAEGDVLVDRHRERRRLLEHHADPGAQLVDVDRWGQDVVPVEEDLALGALIRIEGVDAVEGAEQRRLSAAGRSDQSRDLPVVEVHGDALQALEAAIVEIEVAHRNADRHVRVGCRAADGPCG